MTSATRIGPRVLIVDDEPNITELVDLALRTTRQVQQAAFELDERQHVAET